ncbi:MAG: sugar phosphate nucleotidyltransferase [Acidobacteriota bacterium]|nr:sugar phosphate nucleotidyltransferase [Acidobacteriota bacterium]
MTKAVVLAAGKGTRMGALTAEVPKPMLLVSGKPLLEHVLERLRTAGIESVFLVTGYRAETIEQHFAGYPMPLVFRRQESLNGTARATLLARDFAGEDGFLLTYGDILVSAQDYRGIGAQLEADSATSGVLGVKRVEDPWQGAAVYEEQGRVTKIVEKPARGSSSTHWNSAGLYAFTPAIFDELEKVAPSARGEYEVASAIENQIDAGVRVEMYEIQGAWCDVGRPEDLAAAASILASSA